MGSLKIGIGIIHITYAVIERTFVRSQSKHNDHRCKDWSYLSILVIYSIYNILNILIQTNSHKKNYLWGNYLYRAYVVPRMWLLLITFFSMSLVYFKVFQSI